MINLSAYYPVEIASDKIVYTTGNQTISGNKTFTNNVEIISPISGMYRTGDLLALNVKGFASINADLSSLTGIFNAGGVGVSGVSPGQFSAGGMLIGQNEGGAYIGRTNIQENSWHSLSSTIGSNWQITGPYIGEFYKVLASSDGTVLAAIDLGTNTLKISRDFGKTWVTKALQAQTGIAMSSDGKIIALITTSNLQVSYDGGETWKIVNTNVYGQLAKVGMSVDGRIQTAIQFGGNVYTSYDYGQTWTNVANAGQVTDIAMSSDGKIQAYTRDNNDYIYTSFDYGITWQQRATLQRWQGIAMSSDGRIQAAVAGGVGYGGKRYYSFDYGVTWNTHDTSDTSWMDIDISSDGKIQLAAVIFDGLYISLNYGYSWKRIDIGEQWRSVSMSSNGRIMFAGGSSSNNYISFANIATPNPITVLGSVTADNLVYNTGYQTISGFKDFRDGIYLNSEDNDVSFGTKIIGSVSGIELSSFQNPTDITIKNDFVGGNYNDIISVHNNIYTDSIFGQSINSATFGDQIVIYQTGSSFGVPFSKGPYLRLGENNIISEKNSSKLGIGTLFPEEKVHISGGNLRVENNLLVSGSGIFNALDLNNIDNLNLSGVDINISSGTVFLTNPVFAPNLVFNTGNQSITGIKTFNSNIIAPNIADQFPAFTGVKRYAPEGIMSLTAFSPNSGFIAYHPFLIKKNISNLNFCIELINPGLSVTPIRVGIYSGEGFEGARLFWSGSINPSINGVPTAGIYRTSANIQIPKGPYIVASCNTGVIQANASAFRVVASNIQRSIFPESTGNTTFNSSSLATTTVIYETGSDLRSSIGQGSWGPSSLGVGPLVYLEY